MLTIYKHEMKTYVKSLLVWVFCTGGMGFICILLFSSMQESMEGMAESFASMGAFSDAFGMNQLSIASLTGFYATEVGTIHALGGAMFAAVISTSMLSKEEDGHTGDFLFALPLARSKVTGAKWCAVLTQILLFNLLCVCCYLLGIAVLREEMPMKEFGLYHALQLLMQLEIAAVCYALSALTRKNRLGMGLGIVLLLYACDLMARVVPDLYDYRIVIPFSYANAADVLSGGEVSAAGVMTGICVLVMSLCAAHFIYLKKDLAV